MSWNLFGDDLGRTRQIEIGLKYVLLGSAKLYTWTGGRIFCAPDPLAIPKGVDRPLIVVSSGSEEFEQRTGGLLRVSASLSATFVFDEARTTVEDTAPTIKSVVHEADKAVWTNPELRVPYFSNATLANRLEAALTVEYDDLIDRKTGDVISQFLIRGYLFSYEERAATGVPT